MAKFAQRRDDNEKDIIKALRGRGAYVMQLDKIDLLVGNKGIWYLLEVKDGHDKKLTQQQIHIIFENQNRAPLHVVTCVEDAIKVVFGG